MRRTSNIWVNIDWVTVFLYLVLVLLGWMNIYAAVYNDEHRSLLDFTQRYGLQLIWIVISLIFGMMILYLEVNFFTFFTYIIYALAILLLLAVLFFAREVNGARSWFSIGAFRMQPSEFAKIATVLALAKYLSSQGYKQQMPWRTLIIATVIMLFPALLIVAQPDAGSALVYFSLFLMLFREGMSPNILLLGALVILLFFAALITEQLNIIIALVILAFFIFSLLRRKLKDLALSVLIFGFALLAFWLFSYFLHRNYTPYRIIFSSIILSSLVYIYLSIRYKLRYVPVLLAILLGSVAFSYSVDYVFDHILEKHQQKRLTILLGIESDPKGLGYNVNQSKIAIGSGGFAGKGYLHGTQTKFNFVPEQSTDFIFCTVGEEWGFMGSFVIILLMTLLLLRLLYIAERQRSTYSRVYGYGIVCIMFTHIAVNIGMTIGLLPVIGIPLPFFSYGGSSLLTFTILLFIMLRLDASRLEMIK